MLKGVLCVYKPRDLSIEAMKKLLINRIVAEGNELDNSSVPMIEMPIVEPHSDSQALVVVGKRTQLDNRAIR
uniref:N(6)-L-threonylcarbamoyladenine synthase n=1 Tax=Panagrellus redivivus TaxID=6233 RepID=A0A7E4UNF9_PANRE